MSARKDVEKLVRDVKKQGFQVEDTKKGWQVYGPGGLIVTLHKTPSERSVKNYKAQLRQLGWTD